eukprot:COSAG01_NODE_7806_length_3049_cov_3.068475_4_plen_216_part_00
MVSRAAAGDATSAGQPAVSVGACSLQVSSSSARLRATVVSQSSLVPGGAGRGEKALGEKASGEKALGEKASGEKASGEKALGEKASGEKALGEKALGEKALGEYALGEKALAGRGGLQRCMCGDGWDGAARTGAAGAIGRVHAAAAAAAPHRRPPRSSARPGHRCHGHSSRWAPPRPPRPRGRCRAAEPAAPPLRRSADRTSPARAATSCTYSVT